MTTPTDADMPPAATAPPVAASGDNAAPRWWRVSGTVRDDVRTVVAAHERFAREAAAALARVGRCHVDIGIAGSEWMSFGEFLGGVVEPATLARVELPGAPSGMLTGLDTALGLRMLDRLMGGGGGPSPERAPTELEVELLGDIMSAIAVAVGEVMAPVVTSAPQLSQLTTQPQLLRLVPLTEPALVLTYGVAVDLTPPGEAPLTLCYPAAAVGALLAEIGQPAAPVTPQPVAAPDPALRHLVGDVEMDLVARLQPSGVSADDLRRLRVGDVLTLDHRRDDPIALSIGGTPVFDGALGRRGRAMAVQVQRWHLSSPNSMIKELS